MFKPVIAADGGNYEELALKKHLKNSNLSPLDNKTKISVNGLIYNRTLKNRIEEFVTSENCPADMKKDWEEAKAEAEEEERKESAAAEVPVRNASAPATTTAAAPPVPSTFDNISLNITDVFPLRDHTGRRTKIIRIAGPPLGDPRINSQ